MLDQLATTNAQAHMTERVAASEQAPRFDRLVERLMLTPKEAAVMRYLLHRQTMQQVCAQQRCCLLCQSQVTLCFRGITTKCIDPRRFDVYHRIWAASSGTRAVAEGAHRLCMPTWTPFSCWSSFGGSEKCELKEGLEILQLYVAWHAWHLCPD